jgi:hypothetical protein
VYVYTLVLGIGFPSLACTMDLTDYVSVFTMTLSENLSYIGRLQMSWTLCLHFSFPFHGLGLVMPIHTLHVLLLC